MPTTLEKDLTEIINKNDVLLTDKILLILNYLDSNRNQLSNLSSPEMNQFFEHAVLPEIRKLFIGGMPHQPFLKYYTQNSLPSFLQAHPSKTLQTIGDILELVAIRANVTDQVTPRRSTNEWDYESPPMTTRSDILFYTYLKFFHQTDRLINSLAEYPDAIGYIKHIEQVIFNNLMYWGGELSTRQGVHFYNLCKQKNHWWALEMAFRSHKEPWWDSEISFCSRKANLYDVCRAGLHNDCPEETREKIIRYLISEAKKEMRSFSLFRSQTRIADCQFYLSIVLNRKNLLKETPDFDELILRESINQKRSLAAMNSLLEFMSGGLCTDGEHLKKLAKIKLEISNKQSESSSSSIAIMPAAQANTNLQPEEIIPSEEEQERLGQLCLLNGFNLLKSSDEEEQKEESGIRMRA